MISEQDDLYGTWKMAPMVEQTTESSPSLEPFLHWEHPSILADAIMDPSNLIRGPTENLPVTEI